uniref:Uncharacterized protein n=1 Tax=Setaria digitata TaxID=48799 RepID=A0A915PQE3_9BILA
MFRNWKFHLLIATLSILACSNLLPEACMPNGEFIAKFMGMQMPCMDLRKKKIRVGRNPIRLVEIDDYGPHEECSRDKECVRKQKCKDGCCS